MQIVLKMRLHELQEKVLLYKLCHVTEKLVPPLWRAEGWALTVPEDVVMITESYFHAESLIVPVCPFKVA